MLESDHASPVVLVLLGAWASAFFPFLPSPGEETLEETQGGEEVGGFFVRCTLA